MFYPIHLLCGKRGRLGIAWVAGTVGFNQSTASFLNKRELLSVNIQVACSEVIAPLKPMALRLAAILMLGITRIYKRQTKFLLVDIEDMYKDLKKHRTYSIDLIDAGNNKGANLILTNCVGEVETFETDRLLTGLLSNLNLISDSSYTAYNTAPLESFTSIVMQSNSEEFIANIAPIRSITLDSNSLLLDRMENDDLGGPLDISLVDDSFPAVPNSSHSSINNPDNDMTHGNVSPLHCDIISPVGSNSNLVRQAFNQCGLGPIDEETERPPKRQKKNNKLAIDFTTSLNNDHIRKNLSSQADIRKVFKSTLPKKRLRYLIPKSDKELVMNRHFRSMYANPLWDELENSFVPISDKNTNETVSSTNFSRLLESSNSHHTTSIIRNISNLSAGLQTEYSLENIDINPMQLEDDLSLAHDPNIPCPSPQITDMHNYYPNEQSFQANDAIDSFERNSSLLSFETEEIWDRFNRLKQSARRPFIFMKDLFPSARPNRKEVVKVFYSILKHSHIFHPDQRDPYGEILLPCV